MALILSLRKHPCRCVTDLGFNEDGFSVRPATPRAAAELSRRTAPRQDGGIWVPQ